MIALQCPLCGSRVKVPHAMPETRLTCKKCHSTFHLDKSGQAVLGEPPDPAIEVEQLKQKLRESLGRLPTGRIVAGAAALLVVAAALYLLLGPGERLQDAAEEVAQAYAAGDLDALTARAASGTADDLARWYQETRPRLVAARAHWAGKPEVAEARVGQVDRQQGTGTAAISIHPGGGGPALAEALANPAAATASADPTVDLETAWTRGWFGRWRLDGRETYRLAPPPPETPTSGG